MSTVLGRRSPQSSESPTRCWRGTPLTRTSPRGYVPFETSHLTLYDRPNAATPSQDRLARSRRHRLVRGLRATAWEAAVRSWRTAHMPRVPRSSQLSPGRLSCGVSHRRRPWALLHGARFEPEPRLISGARSCSHWRTDGLSGERRPGSGSEADGETSSTAMTASARIRNRITRGAYRGRPCGYDGHCSSRGSPLARCDRSRR
jgi:hypothetical protein